MKTKTAILNGKLDVGNSCARFDEGEVASAMLRRGSLLYKCNTLKFYLSVIFVCASFVLAASPVEKDDAIRAVSSWLRLRPQKICQIGTEVLDSQTYATTNGATFHVVNLKDGGFVVTSADTDIEPIIAFSASGNFKKDERSPLWVLLCKDLAGRSKALGLNVQTRKTKLAASTVNSTATTIDTPSAKWARLIGRESPIVSNSIRIAKLSATSAESGNGYVEDIRVPPLLKTQWNQNGNFTFLGQPLLCYNLYTPHNYPCGCVATAGAQVMYYHRYPEKDIWWPVTRRCYVDGAPIDYKMQGGSYSWDDMPCKLVDGMTAPVQCEAIGKLTSDVGIACGTKYTHDVSTSFVWKLAQVLTEVFDYENAIPVIGGDAEMVRKALISNLNAKLPVFLGLSNGPGIGHAIVADGYGYSGGTFYVHCNMGYGGKDDAWYAQQNIDGMVIDKMVCNVYPRGASNGVICSGRVMLSVDGAEPHPLYNVTVDVLDAETGRMTGCYTETDHNGIYSMILPSGSYTIRARYNEDELLQSVDLSSNVATRIDYDTGTYYSFPVASINNRHDVDFKFDIQSVPVEAFYSHCYYYADMVDCFVLEVIKDQDIAPRGSYTIPASYEGHSVGGLWYGSYGPGLTSVTIPDSVKGLSDTFSYCTGLLSADIPNSVRVFSGVFYNCIRLESVAIPSAVKEIGDHCFYGCCSLKSATIPNGVTNICSYAFQDCSSLTSITIPNSVERICGDAFSGCSGLTSVTIPDSVSLMGPGVFANCNGLTNVNLSSSLTQIPDGTFSHCGNLPFVKIPGNVKVIGHGAFNFCKNLTTVEIDDGVTEIGSQAFAGCSCLTAISIPPSVNVIRSLAFMLCKSLSVVFVAPGDTERVKELLSNGGVDKLQFVEGRVLETCMVTYKPGVNGVGPERTVTKLNGIVLTLEGAIFTRSGYTQTGWSLTDGGAKAYDLNGAYATDAEIVLYPYWVANSTEPVQTIGEALGVPELECVPWGSTKDWQLRIDPDWTCDGNGSATVGNNLREWTATPGFSFKVTGPTQMKFSYSKSFSSATFSVDCTAGELYRDDTPGEKTDWKQVVLDIPTGEQTVYFKVRLGDAALHLNEEYDYNGFWIDDLQFGDFEHDEPDPTEYYTVTFDLGLYGVRTGGGELSQTVLDGDAAIAPEFLVADGWTFAGWNGSFDSVTSDLTVAALWKRKLTDGFVEFAEPYALVEEGGTLRLEVLGGSSHGPSSVKLYLAPGSATAKDLDLTKLKVDGKSVKNAKFPLTLTWAEGESAERVVDIPIKADTAVEGNERFDLQLSAANGVQLGDSQICTVSVKDETVGATLAQAVNCPALTVSGTGTGKWRAVNGNDRFFSGDRGVYRLQSPALAAGQSSTLNLSGVKGSGKIVVWYRFVGECTGGVSASLRILADGKPLMTDVKIMHSIAGSGWADFTITDNNPGKHKYSYVFTQGSNPDVRLEIAAAEWMQNGIAQAMVYASSNGTGLGTVSGMGFYTLGTTAKLIAKPTAGRRLAGWYKWSDANQRYELYDTSHATLSVRVTQTLDFLAVFEELPYVRVLPSAADAGKVTGGGYAAKDKKVTLKATAGKGHVFAGWYLGGERVSKSASYSFKATGEDADYRARFVTLAEDKASIGATVNGMAFGAAAGDGGSTEGSTNAMCGVALFWPLSHGALSATSVKVSGLPKGLKYDTKKKAVTGVPTAPGKTSSVKVVVTTAGKQKATFVLKVTVDPLPEWARGQFTGTVWPVAEGRDSTEGAVLTMTVGSTGKVSGKFKDGITNWTFSASSFATNSVTAGMTNLLCRATAKGTYSVKSGKKTVKKSVSAPIAFSLWACPDLSPIATEGLGDFADGSDNVEIWRMAGVRVSVGEAGGGTVKMDKSYGQVAAGGKVKLTATVKKGYAFLGWYDLMTGDTEPISQATTYALVSDGATDRFLEARFVKETELSANDITLEWNAPTDIFVGVSYSAKPTVRGRAAVKIASVSGLPKGLSWKSGKISGVPTTVKSYAVKVKVALTTNSKKAWTISVPIEVRALPEWATRTFEGDLGTEDEPIPVTVTIASNGKVSGKYKLDGANWTFSAKSFSSAAYDAETGEPQSFAVNVTASATINKKKKSQKLVVTVTEEGVAVEERIE